MYSSYSLPKHFIYILILSIQLLFICNVSSLNLTNTYLHHKCRVNQGNYMPGSQYEHNLNVVTHALSTETFKDGFRHTTHGKAPNSVTVIFQCRGDSYGSKCSSCAATAITELRKRCQRNKGGIIWYDQCFLDVSMINDLTPRSLKSENTFSMHNPNNVRGDTKLFNKKLSDFLYKLVLEADKPDVDGINLLYYAAGVENLGSNKLYAMVQCAKDVADCKGCLEWSIRELPKCCDSKQGARVMGTSCSLRYELYPFLRASAMVSF